MRHLSATNLIVGDEEAIVSCEPEHGGVKKHFSPTNKLVCQCAYLSIQSLVCVLIIVVN